jgi:hypothetical protein
MGGVEDEDDVALATRLLAEWDEGRGTSKSQLEIKTWGDATAHGRRFDRFIRKTLGVPTNRPSRQSDRIAELEKQIRGLGRIPVGHTAAAWELDLQHARESCLAALRIWNDPVDCFRTGGFSLMFVTAWNAMAIAILERDNREWREVRGGTVVANADGVELARKTEKLVRDAFPGDARKGLRQNVQLWIDLRNGVAHRRLEALDALVAGHAQAGLLNFETALVEQFGEEYALGEALSVPLQLSGFRDPGVLKSRRLLEASLPADVQAIISRAETADPELLRDPTFVMRVAFVPVVPNSGRSPDSVAYFVRPGEVPDELADALERYVVLAKPLVGNATLRYSHVRDEYERRVGFRLDNNAHAAAARALGARPPRGEHDRTIDPRLAEFNTAFNQYVYTPAWVDLLVARMSTAEEFERIVGRPPRTIAQDG